MSRIKKHNGAGDPLFHHSTPNDAEAGQMLLRTLTRVAMKSWKLLLLSAIASVLTSCASGEYQVISGQDEDHEPYQEWNWLPKNS